ncbi:lysophospholipid acyltransferase 6 isoform X2 [Wyeomyia smithii]|uniref:lysophospholipid acyltransferase 6 isoform X2 n=1 Tax=Wyeomyia smithii TaxID=174621 RepID=UPI002467C4D8|nr:lysophospholipid acyltransferase 6 isoform X2 [Wyeomyia smithii]XP_055526795.1 lysophospholipid acyltransferase 6 isoform X2 [Wyeomyia smithii]XP_055526796.1 lysophospholipid acyltransferase 6 isoform X2 [Wyeomyia smithii]XP_055526797.1 lysophospholipid acyltransferase 6 isoform X2 [Wyeomyia smithii]XP_055526798.1 lysophospholipid acyltransferase 6 isoform X2 [Wyeomyia smithii]XP_055526799.1 lysophospholipid acyltransferase 6 isoform X2 [Wyeomyia smithii]XP_055526800.1 lysophospholipid acy
MQQIANVVGYNAYYDGSRVFTWLADLCGLSVDLVNFLSTQFLALILASVFRSYLHPSKVTASTRHAIGLVIGLFFGYFCFGQQAIHIAGLPAVCYVVIRTQSPQFVQRIVMVVALAYLSCIHLHRQYYDYGSYSLDITGPLMIITQKVTSLAFSIHDGFSREMKDLTHSQQQHAIRKLPSALEFFSYTLHFQGLMAGPLVFYKDYIEFIEGYHILKQTAVSKAKYDIDKEIVHEPSPVKVVVKKVIASLVCALIFVKFATIYPIKAMKDDDFTDNAGFFYSFWYMMMATTAVRFKYYFAWLLADAICNNSGLGFNGYEQDGVTARWDLVSNIDVWAFEFGTNFRNSINAWNSGTNRWLRMVVFERVPKRYGTVLTFSLSALWHGFYPGYYITFATGAFIVMSARVARKLFREPFQDTALKRMIYDVLTCLVTRLFMGYATFPFVLLEFKASLRMYLNVFMCLHLVALITVFILTRFVPRGQQKRTAAVATTAVGITDAVANDRETDSTRNHPANQSTVATTGERTSMLLAGHNTLDRNGTPTANGSATAAAVATTVNAESNDGPATVAATSKTERESDNLSNLIKEKFEQETRNIEELIDKTVTGFVGLKDDLMRMNENNEIFISAETLRKRQQSKAGADFKMHSGSDHNHVGGGVDAFLKKGIDDLNAAVQQVNVLPAVLSNGHAK